MLIKALGQHLFDKLLKLTEQCKITSSLCYGNEYIPIFRGLRPLDPSTDLYEERTKQDYFNKDQNLNHSIFTGYSLYSDIMHDLLGLEKERENVRSF